MSKKLWGGRFKKGIDPLLQDYSYSLISDSELFYAEIKVNKAYAKMLSKIKLITVKEKAKILKGLDKLEKSWSPEEAVMKHYQYEDIHAYIQGELEKSAGAVAKKIHTGRSRNDLVVTSTKIYLKDRTRNLVSEIKNVQKSLVKLASKYESALLPGFTHLRKAQPVLLAHQFLAYVEMLEGSLERLNDYQGRLQDLPLGSAALAGSALPLDRAFLAKELGFKKVSKNSLASVSDRAFITELASILAILWMHLSRISEDFILWNSEMFNFVELDDSFATGSSLMPQKKNPDVFELTRGKAGNIFGVLQSSLVMQKGLPLSYNRDMQEDKPGLFDALDQTDLVLELLAETLSSSKFSKDRMKAAIDDDSIYATDILEYLVKKGVPFSGGHEAVGKIVAFSLDQNIQIREIKIKDFKKFSPKIEKDIYSLFSAEGSVKAKKTIGSTHPNRVKSEINYWKKKLSSRKKIKKGLKMSYYHYKNNELYCEKVKISKIVKEVGSPAYIYSYSSFKDRYQELADAFKAVNPIICYSMKANSNLAVLKTLVSHGSGLDIVSGGELYRAKKVKCDPKKIVFAGVGKTEEEIKDAISYGILLFNVESLPELEQIHKVAKKLKKRVNVSLRVNPDVDPRTHKHISTGKKESKFGIDLLKAQNTFLKGKKYKYLNIAGIHVHIGSQIVTSEPFVKAFTKVFDFIDELESHGIKIEFLNVGGGLGVIYEKEKPLTAKQFASKVLPIFKRKKGIKIIFEPGRFIAANSGVFVTKVNYIKQTDVKNFAIVDGAMNDLLRPAFYDAYHEVLPIKKKSSSKKNHYDVVGPVCESGDFFAKGRKLQEVKTGDLLAVMSSGAYGFVMSSNYNTRPRSAEVLVKGSRFQVVKKRETLKQALAGESIPQFVG